MVYSCVVLVQLYSVAYLCNVVHLCYVVHMCDADWLRFIISLFTAYCACLAFFVLLISLCCNLYVLVIANKTFYWQTLQFFPNENYYRQFALLLI